MNSNRIYHLTGTAKEIGLAMGRALGPRLEENVARYIQKRPRQPEAIDLDELHRGALAWLRTLPRRFQEELEGMAEGASLPLQRVAEWMYVERCVRDSCSGFVGSLNGRVWVARNNDMFVPDAWGYLTIREVDGCIPTMCFGMEGDVFTPTGINRDKLWLHYNYLPVWNSPRAGRPHLPGYVLMTEMLETCSTIAEVEAQLNTIDREDGMMLFAVDGKTDEFAIFECTCAGYAKRALQNKWLVGTNHYCAVPEKARDENSASRYARMEQLVRALYTRESNIDLPRDLIAILADDGVERRGAEMATVYANVACPSTGQIWYTFGGYPAASRGDWQPVAWPW